MKLNLSFAILTAAALALAASPADAASKKKSKGGSRTKVVVSKPAPTNGYWASGMNSCASASATWWFPIAAVGSVGCGVVYAVPVMIEGFVAPRRA
jgi:ABC-type sugar transport system substrate-binding protein